MNQKIEQGTRDGSGALAQNGQPVQKKRRDSSQLPWWRLPPVGYIATFPLVGLSLVIPFGLRHLDIYNPFLDAPTILVTLIIAMIWGTEPAVLSVLLGTATFDIYFLPPYDTFMLEWPSLLPLTTFIIAEIIIVILAAQRERGRRNIQFARQELALYAGELEQVNQELAEANQELEKANTLKDHFLSMASHELKTPITSIRGQAQLGMRRIARQGELPPELAPLSTVLESINQQTHRLQSLVDNLLDLSILRSGKMTLRVSPCDVGDLCREVVTEQQTLAGRTIELELPATPVELQGDNERLSQVVTNLVANAIKYSADNSPVQVRVSQAGKMALIQVHNDGPAIPQEQQANIFEPFYRTPYAQSSSKKGWGLGLAISKQIVERHAGHIGVESSEEQGTTFCIELPLILQEAAEIRAE